MHLKRILQKKTLYHKLQKKAYHHKRWKLQEDKCRERENANDEAK
jgi:hypothetical protein